MLHGVFAFSAFVLWMSHPLPAFISLQPERSNWARYCALMACAGAVVIATKVRLAMSTFSFFGFQFVKSVAPRPRAVVIFRVLKYDRLVNSSQRLKTP